MIYPFHYLFSILAYCSLLHTVLGTPLPYDSHNETSPSYSLGHTGLEALINRQAKDKPLLRLLPLGASITRGTNSNPVNGYRKNLRDQLRFLGYLVNMVGCMAEGDFKDNQHEGHPGWFISQVATALECSLKQKPNLVLINAGTNDCLKNIDIKNAGDRMRKMIDRLFSQIDGTTVLLSTLIVNGDAGANANVEKINAQYRQIVKDMAAQGRKIALAEMNNGFITVADISTVDQTHPTNDGYRKLAAVWADAFTRVAQKGWITEPVDNGRPDDTDNDCQPTPGNFRGPVRTQNGGQPAYSDGLYNHAQALVGDVSSAHWTVPKRQPGIHKQFHFAQLVNLNGVDRGAETDELIRILDPHQRANTLPHVSYQLNTNGHFGDDWIKIDVGTKCLNRGVRWGDINGDGLDDFICLSYPTGAMSVSINQGGNPPTFKYIGLVRKAIPGVLQENVRLGDIDGDGRLDYCYVDNPGGNIHCYRNGGQSLAPTAKYKGYWERINDGPTFNAKGMPGNSGVHLVDINGDFRADWVYLYPDGHTRIFINNRGTKEDGPGLKPRWTEARSAHPGFSGSAIDQDHIMFGRIYGTGRADFVWIKETTKNLDQKVKYTYRFEAYKNNGSGGSMLRGDGVRYCDMYGSGKDDFIYVFGDGSGKVQLFENTGKPNVWKTHNTILSTGRERKSLHFGDWDGDGLCDVLAVDKHTGNVDMWKNTYKTGAVVPTFSYHAGIVTGSKCTEGWGTGVFDLGLRFADIDGDGRVDYLCMDKTGRTVGYLNQKDKLLAVSQIKKSEGYDRANIRWADVNSDGKADWIWTDPRSGAVKVMLNGGNRITGGSSFQWNKIGNSFPTNIDRGSTLNFAKMTTSGRTDLVHLLPEPGVAYTYYSECPGAGSGKGPGPDDGDIVDPKLPKF